MGSAEEAGRSSGLIQHFPLSDKQIRSIVESQQRRLSLWSGAVRSGKTIASIVSFLITIAEAPSSGLLIISARTLQTAERNLIEPMQDPALFGPIADQVHHTRGSSTCTIFGRTVHIIGAADARAEGKLRGLTAYAMLIDEAVLLPEEYVAQALARCSAPGARLFLTTNPDSPRNWLRQKYILRADELNLGHWHFTLDDNPFLDPQYVADLKRELTGVFYKRMIDGLWVAGEGAVFSMFDEDRHVISYMPKIVRNLGVGLDFGMNHPTHAVMLGLSEDGRLVVTSEYRYDAKLTHGQQLTVAHVSAQLRSWIGSQRPEWICVDPSAEVLEVQMHYDGFSNVLHADNAVLDGIRMVASLLATDQLVIHESCPELIQELPSYAWDEKAAERGEEKPVKAGDDACDSLRYVVKSTTHAWQNQLANPLLIAA